MMCVTVLALFFQTDWGAIEKRSEGCVFICVNLLSSALPRSHRSCFLEQNHIVLYMKWNGPLCSEFCSFNTKPKKKTKKTKQCINFNYKGTTEVKLYRDPTFPHDRALGDSGEEKLGFNEQKPRSRLMAGGPLPSLVLWFSGYFFLQPVPVQLLLFLVKLSMLFSATVAKSLLWLTLWLCYHCTWANNLLCQPLTPAVGMQRHICNYLRGKDIIF